MEDNQENLACTLLEIRKIAKNTLKFFQWTLPVFDIFSNLDDKIIPHQALPT
jgi:hypothetical protein